MSRAPAQPGALCRVRDQVVRMRKILTETLATGTAQPPATRRHQSPAELVCLALVLAVITLAGRIVTIW